MNAIKFPYLKYQVTPPAVKPAIYVYRPVVPVTLSTGKRERAFPGLIDSGADESTFPAWIAKTLGQASFFSHFDINFNYKAKYVLLRPQEEL